ncbi:MAG: hypothetical protein M1821_008993 [Bathelium mastoideum]|nr:MAG: hypothetical protein M1821_008993 [Bathelium mastoideum]
MLFSQFLTFVTFPLVVLAQHSHSSRVVSSSPPLVSVHYGEILGTTSPYRNDVSVFRGIPYAGSVSGANRWKPPPKPSIWSPSILNATSFGPQCPQDTMGVSIFSSNNTIAEDCLNLNVWTPANATANSSLPVYFWIYGGRFTGGSDAVVTYDGSGLAGEHSIVVVTLNYRLGPLGFLAHPSLAAEADANNSSGNYGLLDMQAALHWVTEEIAAFGGNKSHVVVGGQSTGSSGALDMMFSPLSSDLIASVISESGARGPRDPLTGSEATSYRLKAAAEENGIATLASWNVSTIAQARNLSLDSIMIPDAEGDTIFEGSPLQNSYTDALAGGPSAHADVPILTGNNAAESGASPNPGFTLATYEGNYTAMFANLSNTFFDLYPANTTDQANSASNEMWWDLNRVGTWDWATAWTAGGAVSPVYTYFWTHAPPNQTAGAYHGSELWYTFDNLPFSSDYAGASGDWQPVDYAIEVRMSVYWANFIRYGDPNGLAGPGNASWEASTQKGKQTMWLGDSWGMSAVAASEAKLEFLQHWFATQPAW